MSLGLLALLTGGYACGASDSQATDGGTETVIDARGAAGNDSGSGSSDAGDNPNADAGGNPVVCSTPPQLNSSNPVAYLPVSHRIERVVGSHRIELGVAGAYSGIGASLKIGSPNGPLSGNLIESRSGAGAAHQFTLFSDLGGVTYVTNQSAGNSDGSQWGFDACLLPSADGTTLDGQSWLPMSTDELRPGGPTSPANGTSLQVLAGKPKWELLESSGVVEIRKTWTVANQSGSALSFSNWVNWDAFYARTGLAIETEMRIIYAWKHSDGRTSYDSIIPYIPFAANVNNRLKNAPAGAFSYELNPGFDNWWVIHTNQSVSGYLEYLIYSYVVDGERVGVVVVPPTQGRTTFGYETRVYPDVAGEDHGSLTLFSIFENEQSTTMTSGEERAYVSSLHAGSLSALANAGYPSPVRDGDCSQCVGGASSCEAACRAAAQTSGYCGFSGSTNPGQCCICP